MSALTLYSRVVVGVALVAVLVYLWRAEILQRFRKAPKHADVDALVERTRENAHCPIDDEDARFTDYGV